MKTLHALLFAIDHYPDPAHRLAGCRNDLRAMDDFLQRFCDARQWTYRPLIRTEAEVTREGFAEAFDHFGAATDGDTCLLFYGGHGSRCPAPPEFWSVDPDRYLETIVCYDSREPGGRDLTDKEIGHLLAQATAGRDLHMVAVFDCCHSGTLSRASGISVRQIAPQPRGPALGDLLGADAFPAAGPDGQRLPAPGHHVVLSAARAYQTAKERTLRGKKRGMFTTSLLDVLEEAGGAPLSYQTLMQRVRTRVSARVEDQHPQANHYGKADLRTPFLGAAPTPARPTAAYEAGRGWVLPLGSLHHLEAGSKVHLLDPEGGTREAVVDELGFHSSTLKLMRWADRSRTYELHSFDQELPRTKLGLHPELPGRNPEAAAILQRAQWPEQIIEFPVEAESADFWIDLDAARGLILTRPQGIRPLFRNAGPPSDDWVAGLASFVQHVSQVATWHRISAWTNPGSRLDPQGLLEIHWEKREGHRPPEALPPDVEAHFHYVFEDGAWVEPAFRLRLANATADRSLWVGALYFSEDFGITDEFFPMREIRPGDAAHPFLLDGGSAGGGETTITLFVPDAIHAWGQTRIHNRIKLVVSTEAIDLGVFRQPPLELEGRQARKGLWDALFGKPPEASPKWATLDLDFSIHRPLEGESLEAGRAVNLPTATLEAPSGFRAGKVRLGRSAQQARSLGPPPPAALADGLHVVPANLGGARNLGEPLDLIEMHEVEGQQHIDAEHPLRIRLNQPPDTASTLLPFGYDAEGGFYLPLGYTDANGDVRIESLPDGDPSTARGLGRSLKIYVQQFIHTTFNKQEAPPYPILSAALGEDMDAMVVEDDVAQLRRRVATARRLLVLVHGLVGDTSDKRKILFRAAREIEGRRQELADVYDLLLCFDYESLGRRIEDSARDLRAKLEAVGLAAGHDKQVVLIAHSMGGLVARWFIEREGGHALVTHFLQVGTPNLGSPWARVYDWTTFALGKALNFLPIPGVINELLGKVGSGLEVTAMQMLADSPFLANLNSNPPDPGIPYYILAGNTDLMHDPGQRQRKFLKAFVQRFHGGYRDKLEDWLFKGDNDDIVSLDSMFGPPAFERMPVHRLEPVGCHHFSYFVDPDAVRVMGELLFRLAEEAGPDRAF